MASCYDHRGIRGLTAAIGLLVGLVGPVDAQVIVTPFTLTVEGAPVQAILYQSGGPPNKRPALVFSTGAGRELKSYEWLYRSLADRGYVVLAQRYRDGDSGFHLRDVEDIRHAISHLQSLLNVDRERIGLIGHSRGANATLRATASEPRVRSTIALSPPTDHAQMALALRAYAPGRYRELLKRYGQTPEEAPAYFKAIDPVSYADQIKSPVMLIHGTADLVAPPEQSQRMYDALVKAGNTRVQLKLLPGLGHSFEQGFQGYRFEQVMELVSQWLTETLR